MKLTEFNSINFNATLYVYGYNDQKKQPTDFHPILQSYPKIFDLKDTISGDIIDDDILNAYNSESNHVKKQLTEQSNKLEKQVQQQQQNLIGNRTYFPDYSLISSSGGSEDYSLFQNAGFRCVFNFYWLLLMMLISGMFC